MEAKTRDTANPSDSARNSARGGKKILVIQSASRVFKKTLESLQSEFPGSTYTILTAHPNEVKESLNENTDFQTLPLPLGKRISCFSYGNEKRKQLREQNFDLAVVLYNIEKGWGYANVEMLARSTGAREIRGYFPSGGFKQLSSTQILKNIIREQTAIGWVILNILTALAQIVMVGILMTGEAVYRRVFSQWSFSAKPKGNKK